MTKNTFNRHVDLLLIGKKVKRGYALIKDFRGYAHPCTIIHYIFVKRFFRYCLEVFSTAEMLKSHVNDCFKINGTKNDEDA